MLARFLLSGGHIYDLEQGIWEEVGGHALFMHDVRCFTIDKRYIMTNTDQSPLITIYMYIHRISIL